MLLKTNVLDINTENSSPHTRCMPIMLLSHSFLTVSQLLTSLILISIPGIPASHHLTWVVRVLMELVLHFSPTDSIKKTKFQYANISNTFCECSYSWSFQHNVQLEGTQGTRRITGKRLICISNELTVGTINFLS